MIPGNLDISIYRGDDFSMIFRMRDSATGDYMDLTERAGKAQIRTEALNPTVIAEFTVTILNQTTTRGGVVISLTPAQTAALPLEGGVYDVELFNVGGTTSTARTWVRTPLAGRVNVLAEVTR